MPTNRITVTSPAAPAAYSRSRVLPTPGSPISTRAPPKPSRTTSSNCTIAAHCARRPTIGSPDAGAAPCDIIGSIPFPNASA